jgi:hypothetical protein
MMKCISTVVLGLTVVVLSVSSANATDKATASKAPTKEPRSIDRMHRSTLATRSASGPYAAELLADAFLKAYSRSVTHGGSRMLNEKEIGFLGRLSSTVAGARADSYSAAKIAGALTKIQTIQNKGKKSNPEIAGLITNVKANGARMWRYECMLDWGREDAMMGKDTAYSRWINGGPDPDSGSGDGGTSYSADPYDQEPIYHHGMSSGGYSVYNPPGSGQCLVAGPNQKIVTYENGDMAVVPR